MGGSSGLSGHPSESQGNSGRNLASYSKIGMETWPRRLRVMIAFPEGPSSSPSTHIS